MQSSPSRPGTRFSCTCRRGPSAPPHGRAARLAIRRRVPERSPRHSWQAVGRRLPSRRALVVAWLPPWNSVTCQFYGGRCLPPHSAGGGLLFSVTLFPTNGGRGERVGRPFFVNSLLPPAPTLRIPLLNRPPCDHPLHTEDIS